MNLIWILIIAPLCSLISCVYIENNGYKGITISFSENALDESFDLDKLKEVLSKASELLFHATRNRSYFEEFVIVVPPSWTEYYVCDENVTETPKNVDIYVTNHDSISVLSTQHSKGCGEKGDIIYLPKQWLSGNTDDIAFQFVQEWSTFRYGVFSENPETPGSCITTSDSRWNPTGCYNIDLDDIQTQYDENGLPVCHLPDDFNEMDGLRTSIMFSANSSKMLDFCDGESFPHNPIAPTLHNRICKGNPVWSIIKNSTDFLYGKNSPMKENNSSTIPTFRCFKETKTHLTIMVQDTDTEARSEIRYALYYFLSLIEPADFIVSLATYSSNNPKDIEFIDLDLQNKTSVKSILESEVKLNQKVSNVCLTCGLLKAYEVSKRSQSPLRVIVLLSWESSLENTETSKLIDVMNEDANAIPYFLFLEDTVSEIIPSSLEDAVEDSRGRIFRVKNEPVFMLTEISTVLLDASKTFLHVEDIVLVVHKKLYVNVTSDFTDDFLTPMNAKGTLLYSMQCKKRGDIKSVNDACSDMDINLQSPVCGSEEDISDSEAWKYSFSYIGGAKGTTCSSLALLKLNSSPTSLFTMRGWLSKNKIIPGSDVLIIYTEIYGISEQNVQVEARISGPGLEDFRLELRDNGNGDPDIRKGDNIYSRYFTSFPEKGTYTVSIHAAVPIAEKKYKYIKGKAADSEMKINQTKVIGTFKIMKSPPKEDILPPNRVTDLRVTSISHTNKMVSLQWTAPGDDYDNGKAIEYKAYCTDDWRNLEETILNKIPSRTLNTSIIVPKMNGDTEMEIFQLPESSLPAIFYIALKTSDKTGNEGKISNIVQIAIMLEDAYANLTKNNETANNTEAITSNQETELKDARIYIITGSLLGIIFLIIIINILIWILCFKKYKNIHQATRMKDIYKDKLSSSGNNINSEENILRDEYQNIHIYEERPREECTDNEDSVRENISSCNSLQTYAKVQKRSKNQESLSISPSVESPKPSSPNENDLGFV